MELIQKVPFGGKVVIIGFGSIGQGVLPLLSRHIDIRSEKVSILTADNRGENVAQEYGVSFFVDAITQENYREKLSFLEQGDLVINLSVDVSTADVVEFCQEKNVLYIDTVIEPWAGGYTDASVSPEQRTNYFLREHALTIRKKNGSNSSTALVTHGANPGLVSHFVKRALLHIARDTGVGESVPENRNEWALLAKQLGIKTIHIAERDTQITSKRKEKNEFVNTWSVDGFIGEGLQPAELGWGTHERHFPEDGERFSFGSEASIFLRRPGASTWVRSWTPVDGAQTALLITHGESISIADYFSVFNADGNLDYRPTVHYAYHPCDDAVLSVIELEGKQWQPQENKRLIMDEITDGVDMLGVLLMGHSRNCYWYGSRLSIDEARNVAPYNGATTLQVTAGVLAGVIWTIQNPHRGIVEPDELPHEEILRIAEPYLGEMIGEYSKWTPLESRGNLFHENVDETDPWQFKNFRIQR